MGGAKNFVVLGLANAMLQDPVIPETERAMIRDTATRLSGDGKGSIDPKKVRELHVVVAYSQIVMVQKTNRAYLNIKIRPEFKNVEEIMYEALTLNGKRQLDPPPLKPRTREIRNALKERSVRG